MDFIDEIKQFSAKIQDIQGKIQTEEATKVSIIMPFIQLLGYNVFDPHEVVPEFTADVGTKKGERVDYAIFVNGKPSILIEAKAISDPLTTHDTQLYRYFTVTESKFAILTNGIIYKFYSDIKEPNKMDDTPFLEFNLFEIKESAVEELKKFKKESYNEEKLSSAAITLKYTNNIKSIFDKELKDPSEDFIRFFLREAYSGPARQNIIEKFKPIVKEALNQYLNEWFSNKIKAVISSPHEIIEKTPVVDPGVEGKTIITTALELEAFYIVKSISREVVDPKRIYYKDNLSYFTILFDNNTWKCICRLYLDGTKKYIGIIKEEKETKTLISDIDDIYKFSDDIKEVVKKYLGN
jgi:hypothetical protein